MCAIVSWTWIICLETKVLLPKLYFFSNPYWLTGLMDHISKAPGYSITWPFIKLPWQPDSCLRQTQLYYLNHCGNMYLSYAVFKQLVKMSKLYYVCGMYRTMPVELLLKLTVFFFLAVMVIYVCSRLIKKITQSFKTIIRKTYKPSLL